MGTSGLVTLGVLAVAAVGIIVIYNRLVALKNQFENAFSQIDIQLKRRHDLIPNLVESTKAYLQHESDTLQSVIRARHSAAEGLSAAKQAPGDPQAMQLLAGAETLLGQAMGRFNAVVEAYPDLKANTTLASLMEELSSTENRISFSRQAFNDSVMSYNVARESFPANLLAGLFGHNKKAALLEFDDKASLQQVPKVTFQ